LAEAQIDRLVTFSEIGANDVQRSLAQRNSERSTSAALSG
jgi:hypothetical protein